MIRTSKQGLYYNDLNIPYAGFVGFGVRFLGKKTAARRFERREKPGLAVRFHDPTRKGEHAETKETPLFSILTSSFLLFSTSLQILFFFRRRSNFLFKIPPPHQIIFFDRPCRPYITELPSINLITLVNHAFNNRVHHDFCSGYKLGFN